MSGGSSQAGEGGGAGGRRRSALSVDPASGESPPAVNPKRGPRRRRLTLDDYERGVLDGDRSVLGRAITLVESTNATHNRAAQELLARLAGRTGGSTRVGITGVPGVGKSTFIDALGIRLTGDGRRVAVLAVDPSSGVSGGSILGDKTRMDRLAVDGRAYIRPSPSAGTLGGVAAKTRETMLLCEAAGFDVVIVETVGVGQSETVVASMTDCFLALMLPGAGDELQGIKRGLIELADVLAVNKSDGDNQERAKLAANEYRHALHYMQPREWGWRTKVLRCSAKTGEGLDDVWSAVLEHGRVAREAGAFGAWREQQSVDWMWRIVDDRVRTALRTAPAVRSVVEEVESALRRGETTASLAARRVLDALGVRDPEGDGA